MIQQMIHTIKNNKWVITTSLFCLFLGGLTFFTFIGQSFIVLNEVNLQILLFIDAVLLVFFFIIVFFKTYKVFREKRKGTVGSETSLRYIVFFSTTTLLPSVLITIFSLFLFNVVIQKILSLCDLALKNTIVPKMHDIVLLAFVNALTILRVTEILALQSSSFEILLQYLVAL